jgi:hypothetical protein
MNRSRSATSVLLGVLSFVALAFVAVALMVNWAKAKPIAVDRGHAHDRHIHPASSV